MRKLFFIVAFLSGSLVLDKAYGQGSSGKHGGQILFSDGRRYEVVKNVTDRKMQVYLVPEANASLPSRITVKVKKNDKIIDRVHLTLIQNAGPDAPNYSAKLPTTVLITAGVTFEIDL